MTTLNATFDPFLETLTTKNMASCTYSSMTSNFLDNAFTKIQNMAFKTSKMDQLNSDIIAFAGVSGSVGDDFFTKSQS